VAAVNEMRLPDFSVCLQAQAGIMPLKGKCIPRVQRVVLIMISVKRCVSIRQISLTKKIYMMQTIYRDNKQNYLYYYDEVEVYAES